MDLSNRSAPWYGVIISESENPGSDRIFKNTGRENIFEVEKLGAKIHRFRMTSIKITSTRT